MVRVRRVRGTVRRRSFVHRRWTLARCAEPNDVGLSPAWALARARQAVLQDLSVSQDE